MAARSTTACASPCGCSTRCAQAVGPDFIVGIRMVADEDFDNGLSQGRGRRDRAAAGGSRASSTSSTSSAATIETDAALTKVIPITGMRSAPHLDFAGEVRAATKFPVFHAARISDVATARHAIAAGKLDMVGMTRAHIADPHIVQQGHGGPRAPRSAPASAPPTASTASTRAARRSASTMPRPAARRRSRMSIARGDGPRSKVVVVGAGAGRAGSGARRGRARPCGDGARGRRRRPAARSGSPRRTRAASELIGIVDWRLAELRAARRRDPLRHLGRGGRRAGARRPTS